MSNATIQINQRVICNGFNGTVVEICTGQLAGMCVVRLNAGSTCVSISELLKFNSPDANAKTARG